MTPDETRQELNTCFTDWSGLLANPNMTLRGNIVAWPNHLPSIEKNVTWETISRIASNRQYSFQLLDGSIVQLLYDFSGHGKSLKRAMLAYYQNQPEDDFYEDMDGEIVPIQDEAPATPKWLRLDFDKREDGTSIHAHCHLHISGFPDTRISCAGVPGPRQFVESLLAWLYPEHYRETIMSKEENELKLRSIDVNRVCLHVTPPEHFNSLLHIALPPSVRFPQTAG